MISSVKFFFFALSIVTLGEFFCPEVMPFAVMFPSVPEWKLSYVVLIVGLLRPLCCFFQKNRPCTFLILSSATDGYGPGINFAWSIASYTTVTRLVFDLIEE